ncbi:rolling circle replication-associated protein [Lysinibacillus sphaericus]|uniref:rolling circle replication-associated protein n=1 Tax=Lysinibacillus sphaericus TaxID=1421 RepID=UPI00056BE7F1|nr:hypothetical protein [Lysinibacillus sphaericus]
MRDLQVTITHTPTVTTAIERYVSGEPYIRNGGRKKKDYELYSTEDCKKAEDIKRCSIANSKRTFKGIIHANYKNNFCMLTLTFKPDCDFDTTDFDTCRSTLFWKSLKRCKKLTDVDLRYVGAIEFQQNGNIHFHILCRIPQQFKQLLKSKWKHGGLHYSLPHGSAEDTPKIASYLNKGIHDDRLPIGKKRFIGGRDLERPVVLKFNSRKIIDFLIQRNGKILSQYESEHGFTFTSLLSDATLDELEILAEAENEELSLERLEQLESIQYAQEGAI